MLKSASALAAIHAASTVAPAHVSVVLQYGRLDLFWYGFELFWPCDAADTTKVRVTFPEASAIAEEVRGGGQTGSAAGALPESAGILLQSHVWMRFVAVSSALTLWRTPLPLLEGPRFSYLFSHVQLLKTEYDTTRIVYNRFVSAISQKPTIATVLSPDVSLPGRRAARATLQTRLHLSLRVQNALCRCRRPALFPRAASSAPLCPCCRCRRWSGLPRRARPSTRTSWRAPTVRSCLWTWLSSSWPQ